MSGKLVAIAGTTPNIGATVAAFGLAVRLAKSGVPTGYVCLNMRSAKLHRYLNVDSPRATLDSIRTEIKNRTLEAGHYRGKGEVFGEVPGLHCHFGNLLREQAEYLDSGDLSYLLNTAREAYGAVIADCSAYWDNTATLCAMVEADERLLVTSTDLAAFQEDVLKWRPAMEMLGVTPDRCGMLVTRSNQPGAGFRPGDIGKETAVPIRGSLRYYDELLGAVNRGELLGWMLGDPAFMTEVDPIGAGLAGRLRLPYRPLAPSGNKRARWLNGRMKRLRSGGAANVGS